MKKALRVLAIVLVTFILVGLVACLKIPLTSMALGSGLIVPFAFGMTYYDPDPRKRSKRSRVPPQLRTWVFGKRRKRADPKRRKRRTHDSSHVLGPRKGYFTGPRGGRYWKGPTKRRYDPSRRYGRIRRYGGRAAKGIESIINRFGTLLGALGALAYGVHHGLNTYNSENPKYGTENYLHTIIGGDQKNPDGTVQEIPRIPEIAHLWQNDGNWTPDRYLRYKFLGYQWNDETGEESYDIRRATWGLPFWAGVGAWFASKILPHIPYVKKYNRLWRPLGKIGKGVAVTAAIGALALPNPNSEYQFPPPPPPQAPPNNGVFNPSPIHN